MKRASTGGRRRRKASAAVPLTPAAAAQALAEWAAQDDAAAVPAGSTAPPAAAAEVAQPVQAAQAVEAAESAGAVAGAEVAKVTQAAEATQAATVSEASTADATGDAAPAASAFADPATDADAKTGFVAEPAPEAAASSAPARKPRKRRARAAPKEGAAPADANNGSPAARSAAPATEEPDPSAAADSADAGPMRRFMDQLGAEPRRPVPDAGYALPTWTGQAPAAAFEAPHPQGRSTYPFDDAVDAEASLVTALRPRVGEILTGAKKMVLANVEHVLKHQGRAGGRFGEIAVAMGVVDASDLLWALSQQAGRPQDAVVPLAGVHDDLIVVRAPTGAAADGIRALASQLLAGVLNRQSQPPRALAVVSAAVADGKTYLAANLALSLAQRGGRTILVDADLRTPRVHRLFRLPERGPGLAEVLSGEELLRDAVIAMPDIPNLHLLAGAGPSPHNPLQLFEQAATAVMVRSLLGSYEHVVVDTPAAAAGAEIRAIAQSCGAAVVVARRDKSRMDDVQSLVAQLRSAGVALAGLVMNRH